MIHVDNKSYVPRLVEGLIFEGSPSGSYPSTLNSAVWIRPWAFEEKKGQPHKRLPFFE